MTAPLPSAPPTRRERVRASTLREIAEAGRSQLRTVGPQGLTLSAVARELGMTAPALYRYVDGVEGLITLLIADGFSSLADRAEAARDAVPADDHGRRFDDVAAAVRDWALADPAQYGLLFGSPLPGYAAPEDGLTTEGARRASSVLWSVLVAAQQDGVLGQPLVTEVEPAALPLLEDKGSPLSGLLPPQTQAAGWASLSLLLGAVAVEVFGHMPPCDSATAAAVFRMKVAVARRIVGLPDPH